MDKKVQTLSFTAMSSNAISNLCGVMFGEHYRLLERLKNPCQR